MSDKEALRLAWVIGWLRERGFAYASDLVDVSAAEVVRREMRARIARERREEEAA
jgi:hypothetical protein